MSHIPQSVTEQLIYQIMQSRPLQDERVKTMALQGVIDYFACSLQARHHPETQKLISWINQEGGRQNVWLIGQNQCATARQAALFNGFQAHLLDYDDVHAQVRGHPSAVILSALLSSLDNYDISGTQFLSAYVVGIELMAHLGVAVGKSHYQKGWHNTSTIGGIAATAAICYLHNNPLIKDALAIAATQSSGLRLLFGTSIKPLHAGLAAQVAVQAFQWTHFGINADCDFLDYQKGFLAVYGEGTEQLNIQNWGKPWRIINPGLWFKNYSYCSAASYIADATLSLVSQYHFVVEDIEHIELVFSSQDDQALIYRQVQTHEQGRFSGEYIVASILLKRKLTFDTFCHQAIDAELQTLMQKIERKNDHFSTQRFARVNITLCDERILSQSVTNPKGCPQNPYSTIELKNKLINAFDELEKAEKCYDILTTLVSDISINQVINTLKTTLK